MEKQPCDFHVLLTNIYQRTATITTNHYQWQHCQRSRWKETQANSDACCHLHRPVKSLPYGNVPGCMPLWTTLFTTEDFSTTHSTTAIIISTSRFGHSSRNKLQRGIMANNSSARASWRIFTTYDLLRYQCPRATPTPLTTQSVTAATDF